MGRHDANAEMRMKKYKIKSTMQHLFLRNVCSCVTHMNPYMCHVQLQQPRYTKSSAVYELYKEKV